MSALERVQTGITGLDDMLCGGLIAGSSALVQGAPGTGKTTLGMQFLVEGATRQHQPGLLVSFEQFPHALYRDAEVHGWDLRALEKKGKLKVMFTSPKVFSSSLQAPLSPINSAIRDMGIRRVVVDSATHLQALTQDPVELRASYLTLINRFRREGSTSLVLSEASGRDFIGSDPGGLAFAVDAIILLRYVEIGSVMERALAVLKTRGTDHDKAIRRFEIQRGGIAVREAFADREGLLTGAGRRSG